MPQPEPLTLKSSPGHADWLSLLSDKERSVLEQVLLTAARSKSSPTVRGSSGAPAQTAESEPCGEVALSVLNNARIAGLIDGDGASGPIQLTQAGRAFVRQLRCRAIADGARRPGSQGSAPIVMSAVSPQRAALRGKRKSDITATASPIENDAESPLAWLHRRLDKDGQPMISRVQFEAGERLRADFWRAAMTPRVTSDWSGIGRSRKERRGASGLGMDMADSVAVARQRVTRALSAVGPEFADILIDVCGHLKGLAEIEQARSWPQRSAKVMLQKALTALARHYGLLQVDGPDMMLRRRLRHWGSHDYRPTLDQWT